MTVAFDTLKLARRLEAAGFPTKQAQDTAEALAEALTTNLATQGNVQALRGEIREVELRLRADMASLRAELIKWAVGIGVAGVLAIGGMILTAAIAILRALPHA
jgi:coiled-coil family 90 protein